MESQREEPNRKILDEIDALKAQKSDIEARISSLESQLRDSSLAKQCNGAFPSISTVASNHSRHGLPSDAIYRYSRHLLLPSFGVQGFPFSFKFPIYFSSIFDDICFV